MSCHNKQTREQFINKAVQIHGNQYQYNDVDYTGTDNKVVIHCKDHGPFTQTPYNHIRNKVPCKKCRYDKISKDKNQNRK